MAPRPGTLGKHETNHSFSDLFSIRSKRWLKGFFEKVSVKGSVQKTVVAVARISIIHRVENMDHINPLWTKNVVDLDRGGFEPPTS
ncbi:hypothetical protein B6U79_01165 [Candidatus Bathyarchaeota archaeon ex4484_231]|nr:MAG: hypothetical protein B6U79_01165 [Candidatus Bathyarchaeota archaeon ex4484_231]RJS75952.1 MAG: hypothetical protein CW712_02985 [Candidatus Bathyarchaeota archaeon]